MNNKLALLVHFITASLFTVVIAILLHTQAVLYELRKIEINVSLSDYVYMSLQDLAGLMPTYGSIVTIGIGISFIVASIIRKLTSMQGYYWYPMAGASAMYVILLAMHPILEITFLASARDSAGIALQMFAGAIGGVCFAYFRKARHNYQTSK